MIRALPVVLVLGVAGAAGAEPMPWFARARLAGGYDSNVLSAPSGGEHGPVVRLAGDGAIDPRPDLRLAADGFLEQSSFDASLTRADLRLLVSHERSVHRRLVLHLVSLSAYERELSVLSEGRLLTGGADVLAALRQHALGGLEARFERFDLELQVRGDLASVSGVEAYTLLGAGGTAALRYQLRPDLIVRLRYGVTHRTLDGLVRRDRTGAEIADGGALQLGVRTAGVHGRYAPAPWLALGVALERTWFSDDATGYLHGPQDGARLAVRVGDAGPVAELAAELHRRRYERRVPGPDNHDRDATLAVSADVDTWTFGSHGLYLGYRLERVSAEPVRQLHTRHVVTLGVSGRRAED